MTFSEQIKSQRMHLGLTQAEAAKLCRVSPRAWWKWESGLEPLWPTQVGVLKILENRVKVVS
jgi:transcriptional regulator with XRE-family HTH domain